MIDEVKVFGMNIAGFLQVVFANRQSDGVFCIILSGDGLKIVVAK